MRVLAVLLLLQLHPALAELARADVVHPKLALLPTEKLQQLASKFSRK